MRRDAFKSKRRFRLNYKRFLIVLLSFVFLTLCAVYIGSTLSVGDEQINDEQSTINIQTPSIEPQLSAASPIEIVTNTLTPIVDRSDKERALLTLVNLQYHTTDRTPENLNQMKDIFVSDEVHVVNPNGSIHQEAGEAASKMFKDALTAGIGKYMITSAYRSYSYQEGLYQRRLEEDPNYGDNPYENPVKCLPAYASEHTTGLALDILAVSYDDADEGYAQTPEGLWLAENAHKYGFILRYPSNKEHITGVIFEPWHYRYVGEEAALDIKTLGLCLEEYIELIGLD